MSRRKGKRRAHPAESVSDSGTGSVSDSHAGSVSDSGSGSDSESHAGSVSDSGSGSNSDSNSNSGIALRIRRYFAAARLPAAQLNAFRLTFFTLFAVDSFTQLEHAPRYGAGGFNVSHFPWLDGILPTPTAGFATISFLLQAYLSARVAFGSSVRASLIGLASLNGITFFISQLDSYQHHYLTWLVLVVACFLPLEEARRATARPADAPSADAARHRVDDSGWAVRLLLVTMALVYFWAAIAKMDALWVDGRTLSRELGAPWVREFLNGWASNHLGWLGGGEAAGDLAGWAAAARLVLVGELTLVIALIVPPLRPLAFFLGLTMHVGFGVIGLKIGLFSWLMVPVYLLVLPPAWVTRLSRHLDLGIAVGGVLLAVALADGTGVRLLGCLAAAVAAVAAQRARPAAARTWRNVIDAMPPVASWVALAAVLGVGLIATSLIPMSTALAVGAIASLYALWRAWTALPDARLAHTVGHAGAVAMLLLLAFTTDQLEMHYRYLGGDLRRRGDLEGAMAAYARVIEVSPDYGAGYAKLADLQSRMGDTDGAIENYRTAADKAPDDPRGQLGLAQTFASVNRGPEAALAAERALRILDDNRPRLTTARDRRQAARQRQQADQILRRFR